MTTATTFLRFWRATHDRFFAFFALAFAMFATNRIVLTATPKERDVAIYTLRLAAFAVIIVAIVDKNRPRA